MLKNIALFMISRAEKRLGVTLDYTRIIARTNFGLLMRYNRIFGFLDPVRHVPPLAYHTARLRGAAAADCGTCVQAERNLARTAGLSDDQITAILAARYDSLPPEIAAVARLSDATVLARVDAPDARDAVRMAYGDAGLIELSFAMNGAALLPGIKRAMGYAVACDLDVARSVSTDG